MRQDLMGGMRFFMAVVVFPNICLAAVSWWFSLGRPYVNLDYVFVAVFVFTPLRLLALCFLGLAVSADILLLVGQIFPFVRIQDVSYLLGLVPFAPVFYQIILMVGMFFIFFLFYAFWKVRVWGGVKAALLFLNVGLFFYAVDVYSGEVGQSKFWRVVERPLVSSQIVNFLDYRGRAFVETANLSGAPFSHAGFKGWSDIWLTSPERLNRRLLFIVNESWGVAQNEEIGMALIEPVIRLQERLEYVESGEIPFIGATVAAELRELCRLNPNHYNLAEVTSGFEECLPNLLKVNGYSTRAMHGAVGLMYDRARWYPRAGFEKVTFFESREWPARCYSFPGACDMDLLGEIEKEFALPGKRFFYWLTLNSHSFYDSRDIRYDVFDCEHYGVEGRSESCRNFKLQAQFFHGLAELLQSDSMRGVEIAIVGDHSPPIFDAEEKTKVFKENSVSWLHFKMRE